MSTQILIPGLSTLVTTPVDTCQHLYTHSLAPADFSGAVLPCAFFQKMLFLLYKLRNVFLVTDDLSTVDLVHADFCQT